MLFRSALLAVHDQQARRLLLELLGHTRWQTREAAVQGLQGWGDRELALTLATLLTDPNEAVQRAAATALRELRHPGTERALLDRLPAASLAVQIPIIEALGELHSVAAVPSLVDWVKGTNDALGKVSAEALAKIDDDRVIPAMRHVIYNVTYLQMTTRPVALRVLRERKDDALADRMVQFVTDQIVPPPPMAPGPMYDSVEARMEALRYLQKFGTAKQGARILERLTETVPAEMRPLLAEVLTKLTGRTYRPLPDQDYRRYFVESLAPNPFPLVAVPGVVLEELPREPRGQQE